MDLGSILSGPIGAIFGAAGAIGTKIIDWKMQALANEHELKMRDKDREMAELEFTHKSELAKIDADTQVTMKEFDAVTASIAADKATYGDSVTGRIVDLIRGLIRPFVTTISVALVSWMTWRVLRDGPTLNEVNRMQILSQSMFLAGTAIAWWFGARLSQKKA